MSAGLRALRVSMGARAMAARGLKLAPLRDNWIGVTLYPLWRGGGVSYTYCSYIATTHIINIYIYFPNEIIWNIIFNIYCLRLNNYKMNVINDTRNIWRLFNVNAPDKRSKNLLTDIYMYYNISQLSWIVTKKIRSFKYVNISYLPTAYLVISCCNLLTLAPPFCSCANICNITWA